MDLLAVRKDHGKALAGTKRGDTLQIILIQVKGGTAAMPTTEDGRRLRAVAKQHHAKHILLAAWKKGSAARLFEMASDETPGWTEVDDLDAVFR